MAKKWRVCRRGAADAPKSKDSRPLAETAGPNGLPARTAETRVGPGSSWERSCEHRGNPVQVGPYTIFAAGTRDLRQGDLAGFDLAIPLNGSLPRLVRRQRLHILPYEMQDFGGVPPDWVGFLQEVITELREGRRIIAFCTGSHGRTGCFLGSLIALLEEEGQTHDPILAARARHCRKAVETRAQAEAVFALRGKALLPEYEKIFRLREAAAVGNAAVSSAAGALYTPAAVVRGVGRLLWEEDNK